MIESWSVEKDDVEVDKQPPDKFKIPNPKPKSAFQPVKKQASTQSWGRTSKMSLPGSSKLSTYDYILMKALRNPTDISPNEKMILQDHPVIAELIEQTQSSTAKPQSSFYITLDTMFNYQYCHSAKIPVLYDSREKWSF